MSYFIQTRSWSWKMLQSIDDNIVLQIRSLSNRTVASGIICAWWCNSSYPTKQYIILKTDLHYTADIFQATFWLLLLPALDIFNVTVDLCSSNKLITKSKNCPVSPLVSFGKSVKNCGKLRRYFMHTDSTLGFKLIFFSRGLCAAKQKSKQIMTFLTFFVNVCLDYFFSYIKLVCAYYRWQ